MVVTIIYRPKLIDTFLIEEAGKWVWAVFDLKDFWSNYKRVKSNGLELLTPTVAFISPLNNLAVLVSLLLNAVEPAILVDFNFCFLSLSANNDLCYHLSSCIIFPLFWVYIYICVNTHKTRPTRVSHIEAIEKHNHLLSVLSS